ncbi:hypothetical protein [Streptomyces sp. WMMB 322]|uniref:hypothetical protein n=1 Tax=Streptomyces sp. WMMB 322 TaxID=1286821 RepID=UPI0006E203C5|nr:hypothetical protein [Streptomyces sp. WMMB 322]SCK23626.1 hypothetical protein H180DRAFT_01766 [Streptomyces sp. WMMB 322]
MLVSGRDSAGIAERWYRLSPATRRAAAGALGLLLLAGGGYAIATQPPAAPPQPQHKQEGHDKPRPEPDDAPPSPTSRRLPYPAQTARITFDRLAVTDRARRTFTVEMHAAATSPLTVLDVGQGYEALRLNLAGGQAVSVSPGSPRTLLLEARVTNCDRVPLRARSPFLNVTLRNDRARQELSVIPGERYAAALTHAFRTVCERGISGTPPEP